MTRLLAPLHEGTVLSMASAFRSDEYFVLFTNMIEKSTAIMDQEIWDSFMADASAHLFYRARVLSETDSLEHAVSQANHSPIIVGGPSLFQEGIDGLADEMYLATFSKEGSYLAQFPEVSEAWELDNTKTYDNSDFPFVLETYVKK